MEQALPGCRGAVSVWHRAEPSSGASGRPVAGGPHGAVENLYTRELLLTAFTGWDIEELVEYEEDVAEGIGHKGRSALIGLVAKKPPLP